MKKKKRKQGSRMRAPREGNKLGRPEGTRAFQSAGVGTAQTEGGSDHCQPRRRRQGCWLQDAASRKWGGSLRVESVDWQVAFTNSRH